MDTNVGQSVRFGPIRNNLWRISEYQIISKWVSGSQDIRTKTSFAFPDILAFGILPTDLLIV